MNDRKEDFACDGRAYAVVDHCGLKGLTNTFPKKVCSSRSEKSSSGFFKLDEDGIYFKWYSPTTSDAVNVPKKELVVDIKEKLFEDFQNNLDKPLWKYSQEEVFKKAVEMTVSYYSEKK